MSMASKWSIHRMLSGSPTVAAHIPATRPFNHSSFTSLLKKYKQVFIKPVGGSRGRGVIKVSALEGTKYRVHVYNKKVIFNSSTAVYKYARKLLGSTRCIVQKGIPLANIYGRPFDIRVMVQRTSRDKPWHVTGMLAKVAGRNYVITNVRRSRGRVVPFSSVVKSTAVKQRINSLALATANRLAVFHPGLRTIGLDVGITSGGRVYLIEANSRPMLALFKRLSDRSSYRRIVAYHRAKDNNS